MRILNIGPFFLLLDDYNDDYYDNDDDDDDDYNDDYGWFHFYFYFSKAKKFQSFVSGKVYKRNH
jgi:hypothetical protein